MFLPKNIDKVGVPPIKCQGIKTKLIKFIAGGIKWNGEGKWIEPFLGSGVVLFNICPDRALISDTNKHIVGLYQKIQSGEITPRLVKEFLTSHGAILLEKGESYYYEVRERFNNEADSLDFLFLNRSCFNGVMRFNRKGGFNVPFGKKPNRFRQAYVTKITNQVKWVSKQMEGKDWTFKVQGWRETLGKAKGNDFVYLDPPYVGRHTDYYNQWDDEEAIALAEETQKLSCGFALSMWLENKYRKNDHLEDHWSGLTIKEFDHFYHVGSSESLRNKMTEALVLKDGFSSNGIPNLVEEPTTQYKLDFGNDIIK